MFEEYFQLCGKILFWSVIGPFRGHPVKLSHVMERMVKMGVQALPMASLVACSIGLTLAMQSATEMGKLGANAYIPDLVCLTLLRELGPMLICVIVIGRSGSAVTAELGTMVVSEEIEALKVMAINPIRLLIIPRVIAMMIMLPVLTVFGTCVGLFGAWVICFFALNIDTTNFIQHAVTRPDLWDLYSGLIKSLVFAWLTITIACHCGLAVKGGAEGVGQATTASVVYSLLAMLISDAILTALFFFAF